MKISNIELAVIRWIQERWMYVVSILLFAAGVALRIMGIDFVNGDYTAYFKEWYEQAAELGGLAALGTQIGNYNLPYQFLLALSTYLPVSPLTSLKMVSCFFDVVLSFGVWLLVISAFRGSNSNGVALVASATVFVSPLVILDSAYWCQIESMYASFCVLSLAFIARGRGFVGHFLYGVAIAFKPQALLLLPALLCFYFKKKDYSIVAFLMIPLGMVACGIPNYFAGRSPLDVFTIYISQDVHPWMHVYYPNIWAFFGVPGFEAGAQGTQLYGYIGQLAKLLTIVVVLAEGSLFVFVDKSPCDGKAIIEFSALSVLTSVFLLPGMHDHYGFVAEILLVVLAVVDWRYILTALLANFCILPMYIRFLFGASVNMQLWGAVNLATLITLAFLIIRNNRESKPLCSDSEE